MSYLGRLLRAKRGSMRSLRIWSRTGWVTILVITAALLFYGTLRFFPPSPPKVHANVFGLDDDNFLEPFVTFWQILFGPAFPIFGLTDPPPTLPQSGPFIPLVARQPNCSLTRQVFDSSFKLQPQYTYPNYQDFLHQVGSPSTTADKWANGCTQPSTGIASQQVETIGTQSNGDIVLVAVNLAGTFAEANGQNVVVASVNTATSAVMSQITYPVVSSSYNTASLAVADINGDKINDLVIVSLLNASSGSPGEVSILLGKSDGTFEAAVSTPIEVVSPTSVTVDDMNGDGKLDLVISGTGSPGVAVLLGKGDGTFGGEIDGPAAVAGVAAITADLNGDGEKDVALSSGQILLGHGDGTLTLLPGTLSTVASTGGDPNPGRGIAAADFNHDGKIDLAVTNRLATTVDTYLGNGDGTFTYKSSFASLYGLQNIQSTDLDGDGVPDLFIGSTSGGVFLPDAATGGLFESALGSGDGSFVSSGDAYLPNNTALAFNTVYDVADFNGDGKPDIVSLDVDATNATPQLRVRKGTGDGKFTNLTSTTVNVPGLAAGQSNTAALAAADFDGDSKQDVVFATTPLGSNASTISVVPGNGDGTFAAQKDYPNSGTVVALHVADINGDGKPDLVFISNSSTPGMTTQTAIEAMMNDGSGNFKPATQIDAAANLAALAVADVNGDGKPDLVVSAGNQFTNATGSVQVYLGKGDGSFGKPSSLSAAAYPGALTIADMNHDGRPDIVVSTTDTNSNPVLDVMLGNGDGTFQAASPFQIPQNGITSLSVAEYSGGTQPLAVLTSCCGLAYPVVALGNASGPISNAGILGTGISSAFVKLVDVNGDGLPDILLTSGINRQLAIEVFLSSATASTTLPTSTSLTASAASITAGQSVTFTAQVTAPEGNTPPTGTVTFSDGTTSLGTGTLNSSGQATYSTSSLALGLHSISAAYSGSAGFAASTSSPITITVSASMLVGTTTTLTATPVTVAAGGNVAFSATVAPTSGTASPTGTVTFSDGATTLGTGTLDATGKTTFSSSALSVGAHSVTAAYGGSTVFSPSTSTAATITITAAAPDYGIALAKASGTIAYGTTGTISDGINITSVNGFNQQVMLSCTGAPQFSTCTVNPTSVTPSGSTPGATTLSIMTNVATSAVTMPSLPSYSSGKTTLALLGGGALFAFTFVRIRRVHWRLVQLCLVLCFLACSVLVGCGGGSSSSNNSGNNTPKGTYPITVTGTAGSTTHTTSFSLTIQ
jgi:hypothetical protein